MSSYIQIFLRRRYFILVFVAAVLGTIAYKSLHTVPIYRGTALVLIEKEQPNYYGQSREAIMVESSQQDYYQTQYSILQSRQLARKTVESLEISAGPDPDGPVDPVNWLLKSIRIEPVLNTRLVRVSFESPQPALAAVVANRLADLYVEENQQNRLFISKTVLRSLDPQRKGISANNFASYESLPSVVGNKLIQELKAEHAKLESQWADLSERYTPNHPKMKSLSSEMSKLQDRITTEVMKISEAVKAELSGQLQGNNIRIIDRAEVPKTPVSPRTARNLILGAILALSFGFMLAFVIDRLDLSIKSEDDVEGLLHVSLLGATPDLSLWQKVRSRGAYLHALRQPDSPATEGFRNIRTSIIFAGVQQPATSILVTSALAGEGKTFVACNLASVFAQMRQRVLLVDGSLRAPRLHSVFGLANHTGLSDFLSSDGSPDTLPRDTGWPGLMVVPAGPRPANPAELLSTERLPSFLQWAVEHFDRVIIDSPALSTISDAALLGRFAQSILYVIEANKTNAVLAGRMLQNIRMYPATLLGSVVNRANWTLTGPYAKDSPSANETTRKRGQAQGAHRSLTHRR